MSRSIVIHGHYYQPPREDPWLEEIERQPTAAPFHDWNARIESECYRAVVAARVLGTGGKIARVINALAYTSFNVGPTLLAWLEREAPATYGAILEADRLSAARLKGHGNAIAQAFHHTILPLASRRDKTTEVRWGIADFRRRFGREPEGMWLPETAVDDETLDVLAAEGIRFTILAPNQVVTAPARGMPGLYQTTNGREIALFIYDGPMSHGIAFGGLLGDARVWIARLLAGIADGGSPELLSAASDGETYGHHHRFGEMALAAVIDAMERDPRVHLENFASFLAKHPAVTPVTLVSPSSWSCVHGVERWRANCGDGATSNNPSQAWRAPLRNGMEKLADGLHAIFTREGAAFFSDPWAARDAYGSADFTARTENLSVRARELLELERNALRLFSSCAWFFDDIDRLEPLQIMRYAARAIELARPEGVSLEANLLDTLAGARGNDPRSGTARDIYLRKAKPKHPPFASVAAAHALARLNGVDAAGLHVRSADVDIDSDRVLVRERRTCREHVFEVRTVSTGADSDGALRRALHAAVEVRALDGGAGLATGEARSADEASDAAATKSLRLSVPDLPDTERDAIVGEVRRGILDRGLTDADRARLASGVALADVVPEALVRAVDTLATDRGDAAVARVLDLADLAEEMEIAIPYDAQTTFARVRGELAGAPMLLASIAQRLGFAAPERPAPRALTPA
jgi:hypothetical protein